MGTTKSRALKVSWLRETLFDFFDKNKGGVVSKNKLLANFAFVHNSTRKTGLEILNQLVSLGEIELNGDDITNGRKRS